MAESRVKNVSRNFLFSFVNYFFTIVFGFVSRTIFLRYLSIEYLGLNSLFTNVLSVLSLAELGFGSAIVFALYKPVATGDKEKVRQLLQLYKKYYTIIGCVVLAIGLALLPFIKFFINGEPAVDVNIYVVYALFLLSNVVTYFFAYRRSLLLTCQRIDIELKFSILKTFLMFAGQLVILATTRNYYLYISVAIFCGVVDNIGIYLYTDHKYPELVCLPSSPLPVEDKKSINKNVRALIYHKLGSVFVYSIDSIIISAVLSLAILGKYSNYLIFTTYLGSLLALFTSSVKGSVGNYIASKSPEETHKLMSTFNFVWFWLIGFVSICLLNLYQPFIEIWLGEEYLLSFDIVVVICLNFFISNSRYMIGTFKECAGIFWNDRFKSVFECIVNFVASIILAQYLGLAGVVIGTILSNILVAVWVEPMVLYKHYYKKKTYGYFLKYLAYVCAIILTAFVTYFVCELVDLDGVWKFVANLGICLVVPNVMFLIMSIFTNDFKNMFGIVKRLLGKLLGSEKAFEKSKAQKSELLVDSNGLDFAENSDILDSINTLESFEQVSENINQNKDKGEE